MIISRTYTAKYRDGSGIVRELAAGCRDESAARSVLSELERRAEKVKGGIITAAENAVIDHQTTPLADHIAAYLLNLENQGVSVMHRDNVRRSLQKLSADCQFNRLADLAREPLERWLVARAKAGMGARTRNTYRAAAVAFCNWCIETGRLLYNPFDKVPKANEEIDPRRKCRALTENELVRLLDVARRRPLIDAMTVRTGKHKGEVVANIRPEVKERLERIGRERALIYKTLVLTGLRKGELASITVGQLELDADPAYLVLEAADEKNREGSTIPLRADLAADLRDWLADKATALQDAAKRKPTVRFDSQVIEQGKRNRRDSTGFNGQTCLPLTTLPALPLTTSLFVVPDKLIKILDRDLDAAGIARRVEISSGKWKIDKKDERGRSIDVHALRHTFASMMSKAGVAPRTAQAAMRHSKIDLTMNVYTDPKLLDIAGAVESLPALPLGQSGQNESVAAGLLATGTENATAKTIHARSVPSAVTPKVESNSCPSQFAPKFAPAIGKTVPLQSIVDKATSEADRIDDAEAIAVSAYPVKRKNPLTTMVNGLHNVETMGLEPTTPSLQS